MRHSALDVANYVFEDDDELFLDANIWLIVYGPYGTTDARVDTYSLALRRILEAKCRIHVDVLVVSEFINSYSRMKWKQSADGKIYRNFKAFRDSRYFRSVAQEVVGGVRRVVAHCSRIESRFETLDVDGLIEEYARGGADFNDQVIRELCKSRNLTLVTDDGDFDAAGIPVLTANRRLLD